MSKNVKQKIAKYIDELEKRGVIYVDEERSDFTSYNVNDGFTMMYYPTDIDDPEEVEVYGVVVCDEQIEFKNELNVDVVIVHEEDLGLLSNIHIKVDLPSIDDEPEIFVNDEYNDRLAAIEKTLAEVNTKLRHLDHQQSNNYVNIREITEQVEYFKKWFDNCNFMIRN